MGEERHIAGSVQRRSEVDAAFRRSAPHHRHRYTHTHDDLTTSPEEKQQQQQQKVTRKEVHQRAHFWYGKGEKEGDVAHELSIDAAGC
jgi:alpha/beta superfamily hydrolase